MKWIFCLMALLCHNPSTAQTSNNIKPLSIGDTLPAGLVLTNVVNYPGSEIQLSEYKDKLIILDFWSSWCGACIKLFPYMDSLQQQFKDDIKIVLVNGRSKASGDDEKKIRKIIDGVGKRTGKPVSLPVTFDNPLLDDYFPHQYLPHEVWLDSNGVVLAITSSEEVTPDNIKAFLSGERPSLHIKNDLKNFDVNKPLYVNGNGGNGEVFLSRSVFTGYIEGLKNNIGQVNTATTSRLYAFNQPFSIIVRMAYPEEMKLPANRIMLRGMAAEKLMGPPDSSAPYQQLYCYDLVVPLTSEKALYSHLKSDMQRTFDLKVTKEKRKLDCWVLTATPGVAKAYTKGGETNWDLDAYSKDKFMQNQPIGTVVYVLNAFFSTPLIDETGLSQNIDLKLPQNLNDTSALIKSLQDAGFRVEKAIRELPVTIITTN
ncbi:hypothetical protein DC498_01620 [Terrimonas sp.]|uniref:TlpA family protein disulfide reductase n=1 Tax=Terrimonas sp. TaxID=1914338 RepID=UPI000D50DA39|nr:TlpA disulfide reductase family protein [Terrimonas sp.]PVD54115.1 hypothetical protein DC498_01620 [Terrimonas sp.]